MKILRNFALALFCLGLVTAPLIMAPHSAEARAGWTSRGYSSMGSMGSQTYNYNGGSAINRSVTPYSSSPSYGGGYGGAYGGYGYGGGYGGFHPFWSGLAGGLFGGWLGSMLFPHWGMGYGGGFGYGGGWGGGFFSIIIWLVLIYFGWRLFRGFFHGTWGSGFGGGYGPAAGPGVGFNSSPWGGGTMGGGPGPVGYGGPAPGPAMQQIPVTPSDQTAFEAVLKAVQGAWGKADLATLRHYVTPEMLSYFSEELSENNSQGLENHVEDVDFIEGDVREAWSEGNLEYATVVMHWRARDWVSRTDSNAVVEGDPKNPSDAREMWTFARSPGGHWLLSAIQQV
jgi:hypothetical protein